ncbi:MAG: FAD-binding oxidoreductase, partial [Verrucomicrobiia bacterium]
MSTPSGPSKTFLSALRKAVPSERVLTDPSTLAGNAGDKWFASALPDCVVMPTSTEEVAAAVRCALRFKVPVTGRGAGYGYVGGCVPSSGGMVVNLSQMRRVLEIDKGDAIARVEAGVVTGKLQERVKKLGLFYPPDPASLAHSTIGGNIAT